MADNRQGDSKLVAPGAVKKLLSVRCRPSINASQTLEPETKGRVFHGHFRRSRAFSRNQDAFLSNNLLMALRMGGARSLIWSAKTFAATFSLVYTIA